MERTYQYAGILTLKKSRIMKEDALPKDDILNWLFLAMDKKGEKRFTFFYKIENPLDSFYGKPFKAQLSFIMEKMEKVIKLGQTYDVWRGEEPIGTINIISYIEQ